jgi:hypothetical protein
MNSYFDYINPKSIHIIFDIKDNTDSKPLKRPYKRVILDPRSPTYQSPPIRSTNIRRHTPPKLSLEPAGEWEKNYPHSFINNSNAQYMLNSIIGRSSVPILS